MMKEGIALSWRRIPARYKLDGVKCETCGTYYFPPRTICPKCRRKGKIVPYTFKGTGKIYSYTKVYVPPKGLENSIPYILAIIELDEGARLTAQIVDTDYKDVKIGAKVKAVFRKIQQDDPGGLIHYGLKFKVVK